MSDIINDDLVLTIKELRELRTYTGKPVLYKEDVDACIIEAQKKLLDRKYIRVDKLISMFEKANTGIATKQEIIETIPKMS
jgi:hypothetical protein